jgi:hypothetical protein
MALCSLNRVQTPNEKLAFCNLPVRSAYFVLRFRFALLDSQVADLDFPQLNIFHNCTRRLANHQLFRSVSKRGLVNAQALSTSSKQIDLAAAVAADVALRLHQLAEVGREGSAGQAGVGGW